MCLIKLIDDFTSLLKGALNVVLHRIDPPPVVSIKIFFQTPFRNIQKKVSS